MRAELGGEMGDWAATARARTSAGRTSPDTRTLGLRSLDLSLPENFSLTERLTLQFRAETFNAFNRKAPLPKV